MPDWGEPHSGISNKRKRRPIGILTVPLEYEKSSKKSCIIGMIDDEKADSLVPLPAEASMHWLSPSCGDADGEKSGSDPKSGKISESKMRISWRDGVIKSDF
ncbi:PREDICTED: uncharacterized protein LOC109169933 [Ipomoea nil]|uniref:uncharacterized protein LOC109169933 n=1 Tax=Ipomoea nil TaxID=35883 RepID=UPI00090106E7|nr:PREDICTED: uncharacterized protein LOC109169933 [Ipomoea nil]